MKEAENRFICESTFEFGRAMGAAPEKWPICFVCSRGPKYADHGLKFKGLAVCLTCAPIALQRYMMTPEDFSGTEIKALREGGEKGGAYLDQIEKTDLASLDEREWDTFLARIFGGYVESMRRQAGDSPPF